MIYERINYFLKTAEYGSFSKAAKVLFISPQALTKQIDLLEDELGIALFERNSKGVILSNFGRYALEKLSVAQEEYTKALDTVKRAASNDKPRIKIGIFAALPQDEIVAPMVSYLLANYSDYQILLELTELEEGREKLLDNKLDLLLTNTHEEDVWKNCEGYSFSSTKAQVLVSLVHPWTVKDHITEDDLKTETFLKMDMGETEYTVDRKDSFYENIACKEILKVPNFSTLLTLLDQGKGFAVAPMVFTNDRMAKVKHFDYPGKSMNYHTAVIYNARQGYAQLDRIVKDLVEEFELKRLY